MKLSELSLLPFRYLSPPTISTPFSTIRVPPTPVTMGIVFASFIFISGGFVFCHVKGMPAAGYVRGRDGKVYSTWIDYGNIGNQFLFEGIVASSLFSLAAASIMSAFVILLRDDDERSEKNKNDFYSILEKFAMSSPIWCILSYAIFHMKIPSFSPRFHPK